MASVREMPPTRTYVAFAELLQEWAELPVDTADRLCWGAALTYEMTFGVWRGCNVRVLSSDDPLYALLVCQRPSTTLWRNRTPDLTARAQEIAATLAAVAGGRAEDAGPPTTPSMPAPSASDLEPTLEDPVASSREPDRDAG